MKVTGAELMERSGLLWFQAVKTHSRGGKTAVCSRMVSTKHKMKEEVLNSYLGYQSLDTKTPGGGGSFWSYRVLDLDKKEEKA